jgi:hypothetical protein
MIGWALVWPALGIGGPGKGASGDFPIELFNPGAERGWFTSPITGNKIRVNDITQLQKLDCVQLIQHIERQGVDVLFLNASRAPAALAKSLRINEQFTQQDLDAAAVYAGGMERNCESLKKNSDEALGSHGDNGSVRARGFALDRNDHVQGNGDDGLVVLLPRKRAGRPLIALDSDAEEAELLNLAQHEFFHTRFFASTHGHEQPVGDQIHSLRDTLTLLRRDTATAVHAVLAKRGYLPNAPKIDVDLKSDLEWAQELALATMQHDFARARLEVVRAMDEFDVISAQMEHRNQLRLADGRGRLFLLQLLSCINFGRHELERQFGKPLVEFAVENLGGVFYQERLRQVRLYRAALPVFDRAIFYARQAQFDSYVPELKGFPPTYSFLR